MTTWFAGDDWSDAEEDWEDDTWFGLKMILGVGVLLGLGGFLA